MYVYYFTVHSYSSGLLYLVALKQRIRNNPILRKDFKDFILYFERNWMGRYNKADWCVSHCKRRTNNDVEGHNNFIKVTMRRNPSPWTFIDSLIDLVYDSLATVAANKRSSSQNDRSKISRVLPKYLKMIEENRLTELEFLEKLIEIY